MNGTKGDWALALGCLALLALCASLLINLRAVRDVLSAVVSQAGREKVSAEAYEAPPLAFDDVPVVDPLAGVPMPTTDLRFWFTSDDYPAEALRNHWQGDTSVELDVDEAGLPRACRVVWSSGYGVLDQRACDVLMRRARFLLPPGPDGAPVASQVVRNVFWRLPE